LNFTRKISDFALQFKFVAPSQTLGVNHFYQEIHSLIHSPSFKKGERCLCDISYLTSNVL